MRHFAFSINKKLNRTIGVVGGGQLALMLAEAAQERGLNLIVQTGSTSDPAVNKASELIISDTNDINAIKKLVEKCKCVTFENEWIDIESLTLLNQAGASFIPSLESISPLVDKLSQRKLLDGLSIPGPEWLELSRFKINDLKLPPGWHFPLMAKSGRGGYDGKGTRILKDFKELRELLESVDPNFWLLEKWVDYEKEFALVISRDLNGHINSFPLIETYQYKQVCNWVLAPADASHQVKTMIYNVGSSLLKELNYVGVLAIEFFYGKDGLLVNEIAPRTHNSAHFTIEACTSSQFDQQVCITSGLPTPPIELKVPGAMMVNLLGLPKERNDLAERLDKLRELDLAVLHWYSKDKETPGRKLGHITIPLNETDRNIRRAKALELLEKVRAIWPIHVP